MLSRTINDRVADDKIILEACNTLYEIGVYAVNEESASTAETAFNNALKGLNDTVYNVVGARGYADMILDLFK